MDSQWKIIKLKHQFQSYEQKQVQPGGRCFAELALMGELYSVTMCHDYEPYIHVLSKVKQ